MRQTAELVYLGLRQWGAAATATAAAKTRRTGRPDRNIIPDIAANFAELAGRGSVYFKHNQCQSQAYCQNYQHHNASGRTADDVQ
jgi:hypothetical protein